MGAGYPALFSWEIKMSYIVSVTRTVSSIPQNLEDQWTYHEDYESAKAQYESLLQDSATWTASLTMVLESTDYPTHTEVKDVAHS